MFKEAFHSGFVSILYSPGNHPLQLWDKEVSNGTIRKVEDTELGMPVVELIGSNISTCVLKCPPGEDTLGMKLPVLGMMVKNMEKYFAFEVSIRDSHGVIRRFRASNFQPEVRVKPYLCHAPLRLDKGWTLVQLNLAEQCKTAYRTNLAEILDVKIHANTRILRVFFAEKYCTESELPVEFRVHFKSK